jgi:hypothetical protein
VDPIKLAGGLILLLGTGALLAKLVDSGKEDKGDDKPDTKSEPVNLPKLNFKQAAKLKRSLPNVPAKPSSAPGVRAAGFRRLRSF